MTATIPIALALIALGLSLACAWKTRQLVIRAAAIATKAEQVAAQLTACTTERDQARMEAAALRMALEQMGCTVSITWTDRRMETRVTPKPIARPWLN